MIITDTKSPKRFNSLHIVLFLIVLLFSHNSSANCGKGLELDGINDWVNIPDLMLTNDFTIEGWFKLAPGIDYRDALFGQEGSGPDIHFTSGKVRLYAYGIRVTAKTPLLANTWGHIAITRSGTNLKVYINGVDDSVSGRWSGALSIKAIGRGNRGYFGGMMDEIRIWNLARTESEIAASYNTSVDPDIAGLIGYWNFNESGQIITDASSSANHGSLGFNSTIGTNDPVRLDSLTPLSENCDVGGGENEAPIAHDDTVGPVQAGETISFSVTGNDEDNESNLDSTSVAIVSEPSEGDATVDALGIITYQNTSSIATTDTLEYTVLDSEGLVSNKAIVSITVTDAPINIAPVANDDSTGSVEIGGSISFTVTDNDTDSNGDLNPASVVIVTTPIDGMATVNSSGVITYLNTGSTAITDTLTYTVADSEGLISNEATVSIDVTESTPVNVAPIANNDTIGPIEAGGTISFSVTDNDVDDDGNLDVRSITLISGPDNGNSATVNALGIITYINNGITGTIDTLTYTVADSEGLISNEAIISITVIEPTPINLVPVANDDTINPVESGRSINFSVLDNDIDSDGTLNQTSLFIVSQPNAGDVAIDPSTGEITYTHDGSGTTNDSFIYTVEDDQGEVSNEATVFITINSSSASCGKGIEFDGVNDWVNIPNLTLGSDFTIEGWFKLEPGIDHKDVLFGQEGSGPDIHFTQGKVRLYVYGIRITANTPLIANTWGHIAITRSGANLKVYINGVDDSATGRWSGALSIKAIGRGNRGGYFGGMMDEIRIWNIARTDAEIGASYNTNVDPSAIGLIGYWNFNESGQIITDSSNSVNHASLGVSSLTGTDDPVRFDSLAPLSENCDVGEENEAPIAHDDTVQPVPAGGTITFSVTENDVDNEGNLDPASVEIVSGPNDGTVTVDTSGIVTYVSTGLTATTDTLVYTVADSEGLVSNEATVLIMVTEPVPTNVAPVAVDDTAGLVEAGGSISFAVTDNDTDSDGNLNPASVMIVTEPSQGTATVSGSGVVTYVSTGSSSTTDTIDYTVADSEGLVSNEATVSIMVTEPVPTNVAPVAVDDTAGLVEAGGSISFAVTDNDTDNDGNMNPASVVIVTAPSHGTATFASGIITYVSTGSTATTDTLGYTVADSEGLVSNEATVSIMVTEPVPINVAPVAVDDTAGLVEAGGSISFTVTDNDTDSDGNLNPASVVIVTAPSHGTATFASGIITYVSTGSTATTDTLGYTVADSEGLVSNEATVSIMVMEPVPINVAPVAVDDTAGLVEAGGSISFTVTDNDTDSDGNLNPASVVIVTAPSHGTATFASGIITYVSTGSTTTTDTLGYTVADSEGLVSNEATVSIMVMEPVPINVAPVAVDDTAGLVETGGSISFAVTDNDTDNDGNMNPASVVIVTAPSHGTATFASGIITYVSTGSTATTDTLGYTVADSEGLVSNEATVSIMVTEPVPTNVAPVANDDEIGPVGLSGTIKFLITDNDVDSDGTLNLGSLFIVTDPNHGSIEIDPDTSEITYIHNGSETTSDSFVYTIADDQDEVSNEATVLISIVNSSASCGKGIELDGSNDWVNIPDLSLASNFTIESWVKLEPGIDNKDALFGQEGEGLDINFYQGKARLFAGGDKVTANTALLADTWGHIAITRSGSNLKLYVNGEEDATGIWNGTLSLKAIGRGNRGFLKGTLDEVRVWNVARTDAEISASFNTSVDPSSDGLIGYWTFNEIDQIISDASSSGNHGSLGINTVAANDDPIRLNFIAPLIEVCDDNLGENVSPIAYNDAVGPIQVGNSISFTVTGNDVDSNGNLDSTSVLIVTGPNEGTAEVDTLGVITYIHNGSAATIGHIKLYSGRYRRHHF